MGTEKDTDLQGFSELVPNLAQNPELEERDASGRFGPGSGGPYGNAKAWKHGLRSQKGATIDRRRRVDRAVLRTLQAYETALGSRLTPMRATILANVGRLQRLLPRYEIFIETLPSVGNKRTRAALPVVESYVRVLEGINRNLERVGLDAEAQGGPSFEELRGRYRKKRPGSG